eukprot:SM000131S26749  [mRNA]  locus=s131:349773:351069:+ [translate_table: standard]
MCPMLRAGGLGTAAAVLASPIFFAPAHLHHFWDLVQYRGEEPRRAAAILTQQLAVTTLFGWYAAFLFLRTGKHASHVAAPVTAHVFCNIMGPPDFDGIDSSPQGIAVAVAFATGLVAFVLLAGPLTRPSLYHTN